MKTRVAIVGGGPGGSGTALYLAQKGIRAVLIEKARFPRFHIGESLTGECGNCLRALGLEEEMTARGHPVKYGVDVYGPGGKNSFYIPVKGWDPQQGLIDASTWQVRRSDFDKMLLDRAVADHVEVIAGEALAPLVAPDGTVRGVRVRREGGGVEDIESEVLVDAAGQGTFLCKAGVTGPKDRGAYDKQVAIFNQVTGAICAPGPKGGDAIIFYQKRDYWAWFIPLNKESVSVGVVVPTDYFRSRGESKSEFLARELRELNSELAKRVPNQNFVEETRAISNYSYHIRRFTGPGYLCVGDSHRFIDPVFSFGVYFSMKEAQFAAEAIADHLSGGKEWAVDDNPFGRYEMLAERGQDAVQDLLDAFWEQPYAFAIFAHHRHREDIIHLFAGRLYEDTPSAGLRALRGIVEQGRMKAGQTNSETTSA